MESTYTCGTSIALLSWDESLGRDSFYTQLRSDNHTVSCGTAETHCSFTSLHCGMDVKSVAAHCNSSQGAQAQLQTGGWLPRFMLHL